MECVEDNSAQEASRPHQRQVRRQCLCPPPPGCYCCFLSPGEASVFGTVHFAERGWEASYAGSWRLYQEVEFFYFRKKKVFFFFSWSDICLKGFPVYWCVDMSCGFIEEPGKNDQLFGLRVEEIRKNRSVHSTLGIQNCGKCLMWSNFLISVTKCLDGCSWKKEMVWLAFWGRQSSVTATSGWQENGVTSHIISGQEEERDTCWCPSPLSLFTLDSVWDFSPRDGTTSIQGGPSFFSYDPQDHPHR